MKKKFLSLFLLTALVTLHSCKKEETVNVLQNKYDAVVNETEFTGEDFIVKLNARALQTGERGEWKIISGTIVKDFVYFEDVTSPYTKFKGIPGEQYTLQWTRIATDGTSNSIQSKVNIPQFQLIIEDQTPTQFETIRTLFVNPKYRGSWTISGNYGLLTSRYQDGRAEEPNVKPQIEIHGFANTTYTITFKYVYAGKSYQFQKTLTTGNYTQDEALFVLQLDRNNYRVAVDNSGNVIELNLQASGIAWVLGQPNQYPSLRAFKKLRKLILGGSSLGQIPALFGDDYLELEELSMDRMGSAPIFPENFGNLVKLKTLLLSPLYSVDPQNVMVLPKSFANLKSLESCTFSSVGFVDFNGTLGSLTKLKTLKAYVLNMPSDFGNLTDLQYLDLYGKSVAFPQSFGQCKSLTFVRLMFDDTGSGELVLPSTIGDLKKLETFELTSQKLLSLPNSFSDLVALKNLKLSTANLQTIPENFGNLANLESVALYGKLTKIPNSFGSLTKLNTLFLGTYAQTLPDSFGNLSALSYFNAESSELKTLPTSFGNLKKLKEIAFRFNKIEELPASFGSLDALERLDLSNTKLKGFPKCIVDLKGITTVTLHNTNTGDIPDDIVRMKTGVVFNMSVIPNLTLEHLKYIVSISKGKVFNTSFGYFVAPN